MYIADAALAIVHVCIAENVGLRVIHTVVRVCCVYIIAKQTLVFPRGEIPQ